MAQGGAAQGFLRAAEQGRIEHRTTAEAAAAAMNSAKPSRPPGGYPEEYQKFVESNEEAKRLFPDAGRLNAMAAPAKLTPQAGEPMRIPLGEERGGFAVGEPPRVEDGQNSKPPVFSPELPAPAASHDPSTDFQAAMVAAQMNAMNGMGGMGMGPMGMGGMGPYGMMPQMGMMNPWGFPVDPSLMMGGKGGAMPQYPGMYPGMGMAPGMFGVPPAVGMYPGSPVGKGRGKAGGSGGGGGGAAAGQQDKKERRKRGAKEKARPSSPPPVESEEANANRSAALTEVRKTQGKAKLTLEEVMPHVLEFTKDQHGSRFLQTKLDELNEADRAQVFDAILPHTKTLANDVFGNFVVQKLFDICALEQKKRLAEQLEGIVLQLSNDTYGCRVIQKALQLLPRETQQKLAEELKEHVPTCIENMHGNHVIQKCIEQMPPDSVNFIINAVSDRVEFWASQMYGCRVIQRLLEHCTSAQLPRMLDSLLVSIKKLAMDPYGNYVVQHMLEHGRKEDKAKILNVVAHNIVEFFKNKCSSNVVEKCFEIAAIGEHATQLDDDRQALYDAVLGHAGDPNPPLLLMLDDRFGNYIVQRMIEYGKGQDRVMLQAKLSSVEHILKNSPNGKHIREAFQKEFGSNVR